MEVIMKKEKSCGAVTFYFRDNVIYYLIEHMALGHYSLPKGHVEGSETEIETAKREIKEETNLEVTIDNNFRQVITYSPYEGIIKDVVFFVAEIKSGNSNSQLSEVSDINFLPYKEAMNILTYDTDKEVLAKADVYLKNKYGY